MREVFWVSLVLIIYVYLGYPVVVFIISRFFPKKIKKEAIYPMVSIVISAYNEEKNIREKIDSLLSLDYPMEKMEILIGSDGSIDSTQDIVASFRNKNISLFSQKQRQGKPSMLNSLVSKASGEILVFTDARQLLDRDSLKELVKNFADKSVGSVSAELLFMDERQRFGKGIGFYWSYEKFIRNCESKIGSMLGATGAMYAIRSELFQELPKDIILDDMYIPLKAVQKGYRALFEPEAKIYDRIAKSAQSEFLRKARTLAGNFQVFGHLKGLFNPFKSSIAWQLFSHKFLRLIVPFLLVIVFVSNIFIMQSTFYIFFFWLQVLFYSFALCGLIFKNMGFVFDVPCTFCLMNTAAVVGLFRFLANKQDVLWERT
jgi:cellulose synthase/poly-beta-1,6-N-acetylglucosamine synthase-like glycosyltransferase